jgi:hypothetical protein
MKITLFNTYWLGNIGNAFIDLGSMKSVKLACPECDVYTISLYPKLLFERHSRNAFQKLWIKVSEKSSTKKLGQKVKQVQNMILKRENLVQKHEGNVSTHFLDLGKAVKSEYALISGMILWDDFLRRHLSTILALKKKNVKIIFNGAGGPIYSEKKIVIIRKLLKEIGLYALITRDKQSFNCYHDLAEHAYEGIDCAFFIKDYYSPPKLEVPEYIVFAFDRFVEPKISGKCKLVLNAHHSLSPDSRRYLSATYKVPENYFASPYTLISDSPYDYLTLYSNTTATFSDRIHACIATLAYGHPARLFVVDDEVANRKLLFERIGAKGICGKLTYPDINKIEKAKESQVKFLSDILLNA